MFSFLSSSCVRRMRFLCLGVVSMLVVIAGIPNALAVQRVALVIGNANYQHHDRLRNPRSDAELMAQTFRASRFDSVESVADTDQLALLAALSTFKSRAAAAELAVIYYSGHGMKHVGERQNYVLPVDMPNLAANASLDPDLVLKSRAVSESALLAAMGDAKYQLLILDACRDNGGRGSKSGDKGLTRRAGVGPGRLIAYATEENRTAKDGAGRYSPYAESLARHLSDPRLSIVQALDATADEVRQATGNAQQPMKSGDLAWDVRLDLARGERRDKDAPSNRTAEAEAAAWALAVKANTAVAYQAYLAAFPAGTNRAAADTALKGLTPPGEAGSGGDLATLIVTRQPSRIKTQTATVFAVAASGKIATSALPLKTDYSSLQTNVLLYDDQGVELARLAAAKNSVTGLSFSPDGNYLAVTDYNDNCHLWNVRDFSLIRTIERAGRCRWLAGSSDQLLLGARYSGLASHQRSSGQSRVWQRAAGHYFRHATSDGLVVTEKDSKLWFWRNGPDTPPLKFDLPKDAYTAFGRRHFYVGTESDVAMVEFATLKRVSLLRPGLQTHGDFATFHLHPSEDEQHIALAMTIGNKTTMQLWRVDGWLRLHQQTLRSSDGLQRAGWSPDNRIFAFNAGYDGTGNHHRVGVFDVGRRALGFADGTLAASPVFASDGRTFRVPSAQYVVH